MYYIAVWSGLEDKCSSTRLGFERYRLQMCKKIQIRFAVKSEAGVTFLLQYVLYFLISEGCSSGWENDIRKLRRI